MGRKSQGLNPPEQRQLMLKVELDWREREKALKIGRGYMDNGFCDRKKKIL